MSPLPPIRLAWPVATPRLTSGFGPRILSGKPQVHPGLDFGVAVGTPVLAAASGRVFAAGLGQSGNNPDETYGLRVVLEHEGGWLTTYNHLTELVLPGMALSPPMGDVAALAAWARALKVADGSWAKQNFGWRPTFAGMPVISGQQIGLSGGVKGDPRSGLTTAPHLHFELRRELPRTYFDPMPALASRPMDSAPRWVFGAESITSPGVAS